jgi:hypothetical protein
MRSLFALVIAVECADSARCTTIRRYSASLENASSGHTISLARRKALAALRHQLRVRLDERCVSQQRDNNALGVSDATNQLGCPGRFNEVRVQFV